MHFLIDYVASDSKINGIDYLIVTIFFVVIEVSGLSTVA
jgi:hypothetical protein